MKIFKILISFVVLAGVIYGLKKNPEKIFWSGFTVKFVQNQIESDFSELKSPIVVAGDSTAQFNINTNLIPRSSSIALPHAPLFVSYFHLRRMIESGKSPKIVILGNSMDWVAHSGEGFWSHIIGPDLLSWNELFELYREKKQLGEALWYERDSDLSIFVHALLYKTGVSFLKPEYLQFSMRNLGNDVLKKNLNYLLRSSGHVNYGIRDRGDVDNQLYIKMRDFKESKLEDLYLKKIGALCDEHSIKLVFVHFPFKEPPNLKEFVSFVGKRKEHLNALLSMAQIQSIDFEAIWPDSFFSDYTHLNRMGSTVLTQKLRFELIKLGVLP